MRKNNLLSFITGIFVFVCPSVATVESRQELGGFIYQEGVLKKKTHLL